MNTNDTKKNLPQKNAKNAKIKITRKEKATATTKCAKKRESKLLQKKQKM